MKYWILAILLTGLLGYAFGRYVQPAKTEIKEVQTVKQDVKVITKTVTSPDGTKTVVVTNETKSEVQDKKDSLVINTKPQWNAHASAGLDTEYKLMYGIDIERRIIGPVSAGVWLNTKKEFGISVGLEF